ncbi:MAG: aminotransferase class I/II-fold pyridoxal phosphate-dependent enzyme [Planctomycetota bacterium]
MSLDPEPEEMRRLGHRAVDLAVSHLSALHGLRVAAPPDGAEFQRRVAEELPRTGRGIEDSMERYFRDLLPKATLVNHPRFFAYIPGPGSFAGALGEWLAAATNAFVGTWLGGAVMAQLELQTLAWLREAVGLSEDMSGILTTGGSMANLGALVAGLEGRDRTRAVLYASAESHYSLSKAGAILGIPRERRRLVATTNDLRLDAGELRRLVAEDRARGLEPAVIAATAGTTNSGAVDPMPEIADLCAAEGIWMHVDAAYGGAMGLWPEGRRLLRGWERADSVAFDPHKWFYSPFECGCLLVRDVKRLEAAFAGDADYMQDVPRDEANFFLRGPELTRGNRALKLWLLLRGVGIDRIADQIRKDLDLCRLAFDLLREDGRVEMLTPPQMSIFTFALRAGDEAGRRFVGDVLEDGFLMLSSTRIRGRFAVRFCVCNHRTTERDVREAVSRMRTLLPGKPPDD